MKTLLVIGREYAARVRGKGFWILAVIVPLILVTAYVIPVLTATRPQPHATVLVVDETGLFSGSLTSNEHIQYQYAGRLEYARRRLLDKSDSTAAVLHILRRETTIPTDAHLYYRPGTADPTIRSDADAQLQRILVSNILLDVAGISPEEYKLVAGTHIALHVRDIDTGQDPDLPLRNTLAIILALLMLVAIAIFGTLITGSVLEEKQNRMAEVLLSTLKPFQLLMGKILATTLLAVTLLTLWTAFTAGGICIVRHMEKELFSEAHRQNQLLQTPIATKGAEATAQMQELMETVPAPQSIRYLDRIHFAAIVPVMLFFFMLGLLLYAGLVAALASIPGVAVGHNLLALPLLLPLALPLLMAGPLLTAPSGTLATTLSLIPFTAPAAIALRLPFGIPLWQAALSAALLIIAIPMCTLLAAIIYRHSLLPHQSR